MGAIKIDKFVGMAPKVARELLPDNAAQRVVNAQFGSGSLIPYSRPKEILKVNSTALPQGAKSIFLVKGDGTRQEWIVDGDEADTVLIKNSYPAEEFGRVYQTGNFAPRWSTIKRVIDNQGQAAAWSNLGVPIPSDTAPMVYNRATSFYGNFADMTIGQGTISGRIPIAYTRDYQREPYRRNIKPGLQIRVTQVYSWSSEAIKSALTNFVGYLDGVDMHEYAASMYFDVNLTIGNTTLNGQASCYISNIPAVRRYAWVLTFVYADGEESAPTKPVLGAADAGWMNAMFLVAPSYTMPPGAVAARLYRTISTGADTDYFFVKEITYSAADNWIYDAVPDSELGDILDSQNNDPPEADLRGLTQINNNMLAAFKGNEVHFSLPGRYYAWPTEYILEFPYEIVGLAAVQGYVIVLTKGYPYAVSGSHPSNMTPSRIDAMYPCLSKESIVVMDIGVVWATYLGLANYAPSTGAAVLTQFVHDELTWVDIHPATLEGALFDGKYFGSSDNTSFVFTRDDKVGGFYTLMEHDFRASFVDYDTGTMYFATHDPAEPTVNTINAFTHEAAAPLRLDWKSKEVTPATPINLGAGMLLFDDAVSQAYVAQVAANNDAILQWNTDMWYVLNNSSPKYLAGTIAAPAYYGDWEITPTGGSDFENQAMIGGTYGAVHVAGNGCTKPFLLTPQKLTAIFTLWVDKNLRFQCTAEHNKMFRLPRGYKSEHFEFGVNVPARLRAVEVAETPSELGKV